MLPRLDNRLCSAVHALACVVAWTFASPSVAADLMMPGSQPKASAGAGQTVSRGSSSLFYNPANLMFSKWLEPDLDVSYLMTTYTYRNVDDANFPDPVVISKAAPVVTAGISFRPVPSFAVGLSFFPNLDSKASVARNVPLQFVPNPADPKLGYKLYDFVTTHEANKLALGVAYRLDYFFSFGLSFIRHYDKYTVLIDDIDLNATVVDAIYGGEANQFAIGFRSEILDRMLVLALSYKSAVTRKFGGFVKQAPDGNLPDEDATIEAVDYIPAVIGFGAETRFDIFGFFLDYTLEQWAPAGKVYRKGYLAEPPIYSFTNANNIVLGSKLWIAPKHMIEVAGGMYGGNQGVGEQGAPDAQDPRVNDVGGVTFGNLEAVPRIQASLGYRAKLSGAGYVQLGFLYASGTKAVGEEFDGAGNYGVSAMQGSLGIAYGF